MKEVSRQHRRPWRTTAAKATILEVIVGNYQEKVRNKRIINAIFYSFVGDKREPKI